MGYLYLRSVIHPFLRAPPSGELERCSGNPGSLTNLYKWALPGSSILHPGDGSTWELFCSKQLVPDWLPKSPRSWGQSFGPHDPSLEADRHPQATGTRGRAVQVLLGLRFPSRAGAIEKPCFLTPTPNNPAEPSLAPRATHPECLATFLPEETMYPWLPALASLR